MHRTPVDRAEHVRVDAARVLDPPRRPDGVEVDRQHDERPRIVAVVAVRRRDQRVGAVRAVDEALGFERGGRVRRGRVARRPRRPPGRGGTSGASAGGGRLVHGDPASVERELDDGRTLLGERLPEGALELGVALHAHAARADGPGDRREVDRPELGRDALAACRGAPATSGSCRSARCRRRRR